MEPVIHGHEKMKISIIVPVYNAEKYITPCVESIVLGSRILNEVILVDDGSTDESGRICDELAVKYECVAAYHVDNKGPGAARNFGLSKASGDYVQFVDADDEIIPGFAESFLEIASNNRPDIIVGGYSAVLEDRSVLRTVTPGETGPADIKRTVLQMSETEKEILLHYVWNKWYRRELITDNGFQFDKSIRLGEDFIFNCAFFKKAKTVSVSDATMYRYFKRGNATLSNKFDRHELDRRRHADTAFVDFLEYFGVYAENREYYDAMIGAKALQSIEDIARDSCSVPFCEKVRYVREFCESEYNGMLRTYMQSSRCKLADRAIIKKLCGKKSAAAAVLIVVIARLKRIRKKLNRLITGKHIK